MSPHRDGRPRNLRARSSMAGQGGSAAPEVEQWLEPPTQHDVAAFFDVDNTMLRGAAIIMLAKGGLRTGLFNGRDLAGLARKQLHFAIFGEDQGHIDDARNSALSLIAGKQVSTLEELAEDIFDSDMAQRIWPGTRALAQWHLDSGHRVWLVTAAPAEIARVIARRMGLTGGLGTLAEHEGGVYTGRLVGDMLHGQRKAETITALAEQEGLDLARCYAYSDSSNDIPMLSLVGNPCAVNPDRELRKRAEFEGWTIRDYRLARKAAVAGVKLAAGATVLTASGYALRALRSR